MADFTSPRPVEQVKEGAFLHDLSNRPKAPPTGSTGLVQRQLPLLLGLALSLLLVALAFQARDTWGAHRDWVVPVTAPLLALGGVAIGHLAARREWNALLPAGLILGAIGLLTAWDGWLDADDKEDSIRDGIAIANAALLSLSVLASVVALAWVELGKSAAASADPAERTAAGRRLGTVLLGAVLAVVGLGVIAGAVVLVVLLLRDSGSA